MCAFYVANFLHKTKAKLEWPNNKESIRCMILYRVPAMLLSDLSRPSFKG